VTTTYTWAIANLEREAADGYVFTAHYVIAAISDQLDSEGNPYTASGYGSIGLERPIKKKLVPFENLTADLVVGWVKDKLGADRVAEVEAALTAQIEERINPTKLAGLPWNS
jgi:hypothetical protein